MVEKVWLKSYPEGVPAEVPEPPNRSLRDMIEAAFRDHPDRPSFTSSARPPPVLPAPWRGSPSRAGTEEPR